MACRVGALFGVLLSLSVVAGCSLARDVIGGSHEIDSGVHDAGMRDAPAGCLTSCDDHEPCTTDTCDATGTCRHTNAAGACDDHVLCNGADSCGGGTCSVHDHVDPCPGTSHCDAATDTCTGCATTSDCPAPTMGAWGACDFGTDLCTTNGMQTRSSTTYACTSGACQPTTTTSMQACTRASTDGTSCAALVTGDWTACAFADACTRAGTQSRVVTTSLCAGGTCQATDMPEMQACMRASTDGTTCGATTTTAWSDCMVGSTCATTGTQTRTSTTYTCMGGTCTTMVSSPPESQSCTVPTGGSGACGATTCDPWSTCTQTMPNTCSQTGTQMRTCHTPTCGTGPMATCSGSTSHTEMQSCSVDVAGLHVPCASTFCGGCRTGPGQCPHGHTGQQTCNTYSGTCTGSLLGTYCMTTDSSQTTQSCTCP